MQISYSTSHQALLNQYFIFSKCEYSCNIKDVEFLVDHIVETSVLRKSSWCGSWSASLQLSIYQNGLINEVNAQTSFSRYSPSGESSHLSQNPTSFNNPFLEWNHFFKILLFWCFSSPNWFVHRPRPDLNLNAFDWIWIAAPKNHLRVQRKLAWKM